MLAIETRESTEDEKKEEVDDHNHNNDSDCCLCLSQPLIPSSPIASEPPATPDGSCPKERSNMIPGAASHRAAGCTALSMIGWCLLTLLRTSVMELPLLILFAGWVATHVLERFTYDYLLPLQDLQEFKDYTRRATELTYYHRVCDERDVSANDTAELIVNYDTMTPEDAMHHQLKHGVQVYPNLLSQETATQVRNWILAQNEKNEDMIPVIENQNRWSFGVRVDQHPSVEKALGEVLSNPFLVQAMEHIMGPDPAVIEFTGITSAYGAAIQRYHADVVPTGNGAKWGRNFIPSYSLFIPLQNITGAMGATEICPGSHMCADGVFEYCPDYGFPVSGQADNWPMGWGALVNQQTMHRGGAHNDPNGPHRVLFIVTFAPRPRFGPFQVETRSLGQGGSYSLHWTQWGHTLRDFQYSFRYMRQPWRFFRSMGWYKPKGRPWGWDYVTQVGARIANNENGFSLNDWMLMMNQNQFKHIPRHLHGTVDITDYTQTSRQIWNKFYLETLRNVRSSLFWIYFQAAVTYLVVLGTGALVLAPRRRGVTVAWGIARFALTHGLVFFLAGLVLYRIAHSTYGKNLRSGRSFTWPELPHPRAPNLPGTLPTRDDIMLFDDMQSEYLASYTQVLDHFHPGNRVWNDLVPQYTVGYTKLPSSMKRQLCKSMLNWSLQQGRRVLVKNIYSNWAEADEGTQLRFCHKEIMKRVNPNVERAVREVDFLLSETKFGYWRQSRMHQKWIPDRLVALQNKIMRYPFMPTNSTVLTKALFFDCSVNKLTSNRFKLPPTPRRQAAMPKSVLLRPVLVSQEPEVEMDHHWKQGDQVEGAYGQFLTGKNELGSSRQSIVTLTHKHTHVF